MIPYASAMGEGRNRSMLLAAGWGLLISPLDPRSTEGFQYCLDNGEWPAFQAWVKAKRAEGFSEDEAIALWMQGGWRTQNWDEAAFERALERYGPGADFVVLPDIVGAGMDSLQLSLRWSNRCMASCELVLIAVQDGMEPADLAPYVGPRVGIFLGGSTEWKLARMQDWGHFCFERQLWYHVARVNTERRFKLAHASEATSIDGSSASKFADTIPQLDEWRQRPAQPDLFAPNARLL